MCMKTLKAQVLKAVALARMLAMHINDGIRLEIRINVCVSVYLILLLNVICQYHYLCV